MSNKIYDLLKFLCTVLIPAFSTLYFALSEIWGLPLGAQVVGTLAAIDTFIGVCIGISSANYTKNED